MAYNVKAFDDGFGDNKGFAGKEPALIIPSFVTRWQPIPEADLVKGEYSDPYSHITVEYDGYKYLVGEAAQKLDKKGNWVAEENKHNSEKFIPMMKAQLALLCQNDMEKEVVINPLVMGLPVEQDTPGRRELLGKLVKGEHKVKVTLADGTVIDKEITVENLMIVKQPFGSFADVALDDSGNIKDELINQQMTVVFDLGARTLNVITLRGFEVINGLSFTEPLGVVEAWEGVHADILQEFEKHIPMARIPDYCKKGFISSGDDISKITEQNYKMHTDELLSLMGSRFIHNKDEVDRIILTGGGSEVLLAWLKQGMALRFPKAKIETKGRTATVKGYYNFGKRFVRSQAGQKQAPKASQEPVAAGKEGQK
ncbi:hypothetical protein ACPA0F_18560 [Solibacillus silvestris]